MSQFFGRKVGFFPFPVSRGFLHHVWFLHLLAVGMFFAATLSSTSAVSAQIPVDLELVLAVDTSGSVDMSEYRLQMKGVAAAFRDPAVVAAIYGTGPKGIAVTLVHWSSAGQQKQIVPWTQIYDTASADAFAAAVDARPTRHFYDSTGIGAVIQFGERLIRRNLFEGRRKSIDISSDGVNNSGIPPEITRDDVVASGVTINGLAVLDQTPHLESYFAHNVIGGAGAFVMTVESYMDIIAAIRAKLLREISISIAKQPRSGVSPYR